jgi:hypothetical protein
MKDKRDFPQSSLRRGGNRIVGYYDRCANITVPFEMFGAPDNALGVMKQAERSNLFGIRFFGVPAVGDPKHLLGASCCHSTQDKLGQLRHQLLVGYASLFASVLGLVTKNIEQLCEGRNSSAHSYHFSKFKNRKLPYLTL